MKNHTQQFIRQRKLFVALPILVLPFLPIIFYALGGGQGSSVTAAPANSPGLNALLPTAHFDKDQATDKLSLYDQAQQDSAKFKEARESDPYFDLISFENARPVPTDSTTQSNLIASFRQKDRTSIDANEEKVNRKLEQLYKEINKSSHIQQQLTPATDQTQTTDPQFTQDVQRLEQLMESINESRQQDPEMQQIGSLLDKILDIQHPDRVVARKSEPENSADNTTTIIQTKQPSDVIRRLRTNSIQPLALPDTLLIESKKTEHRMNRFYSVGEHELVENAGNVINAVVHDTQELVNGSTIKLRISEQTFINGHLIPKDQIVFGVCNITGDRLTIKLSSIRVRNSILPITLSAYDMDGIQGLYIPGAILRDQAKEASSNSLQNMQMMSINPSLSAQVANAGVEAAKGFFGKKAKLIKVTVKAEYKLFLQQSI